MVELLEPLFLQHIERIANFIIMLPHEIKKIADPILIYQIPYAFAGLQSTTGIYQRWATSIINRLSSVKTRKGKCARTPNPIVVCPSKLPANFASRNV